MEPLYVTEQIRPRLVTCPIPPMVHVLPMDDSEKCLAGCLVSTVAGRTHAANERVDGQELLVGIADELATAIGAQDDPMNFPDTLQKRQQHIIPTGYSLRQCSIAAVPNESACSGHPRPPGQSDGNSTATAGPARSTPACSRGCNVCASTRTLHRPRYEPW